MATKTMAIDWEELSDEVHAQPGGGSGGAFVEDDQTTVMPAVTGLPRKPSARRSDATAPDDTICGAEMVAMVAFTRGSATGKVIAVPPQQMISIGRGELCAVCISDPTISRVHIRLRRVGFSVSLTDGGSTNGTFVNGYRVEGTVPLRNGDSVCLGMRHGFRFFLGDESELHALGSVYESATRDALTGLLNRRMFDQAVEGEIAFARRHGTSLALLILDVDRFKNVNDLFGHAAGDALLREIGTQFRDGLRAEDLVARVGGEEFALVLRDVDRDGAEILAYRARALLQAARVEIEGVVIAVTASVGVAMLDECPENCRASELVRLADERLYKAKQTRDCVVSN